MGTLHHMYLGRLNLPKNFMKISRKNERHPDVFQQFQKGFSLYERAW
jgi:hypothetical protein